MDMLPKSIVPDDLLKGIGDGLYTMLETRASLQAKLLSHEITGEGNPEIIKAGLQEIDNYLQQVTRGFQQIKYYVETRAASTSYVWQPKVINSQEAP